ncbi:M48 family metallopeptidase [Alistipes sp.]|uniref:M48 family metallopeptidase n=1 Tax=Alistipes sp. TaxID=1872444 RepID=UPI0025BD3253|nr:M48 family metallopeptidase [Alistipes sp.]MCI7141300.1 M48 family metallopeptidase [Alistipes sp.]MDY5397273.1 M48 family metallopeptidase [Alistipes sp.]
MEYVGIQTQKSRNDARSIVLILMFPCLVVGMVYLFCLIIAWLQSAPESESLLSVANVMFAECAPYALGGTLVWFVIAYFANTQIIKSSTGAKPLERRECKRVYNLVENLCLSQGMKMPKINIIDDASLNAFASGINERTYTVTLSKGIIDKLDDAELEAVIAHELSHIRNHDVRLMIVSIVFVGVFSMVAEIAFRSILYTPRRNSSRDDKGSSTIVMLLVAIIVAAIGYLLAVMMRFAISRKREYLADAGAAEMTRNPLALASALRKISADPDIEAVTRDDVAQLFIQHPGKQASGLIGSLGSLFATHPPIEERIRILEQF